MKLKTTLLIILAAGSTLAQGVEPALADVADNGDGSYTNWFGTFTPETGTISNNGWMVHAEHGRVYVEAHEENLWIYDPNVAALNGGTQGWIYSNRVIHPYFYILGVPSTYLLFISGVEGPDETPRVFVDPQTFSKVFLPKATTSSIVDIAVGNGNFNSLVQAVVTADLAETLSGEGSFTVFAPVDSAFAALDASLLNDLLTNADRKGDLTDILTYHVLPGRLTADQLGLNLGTLLRGETISGYLETLNGSSLRVDTTPFGVLINGNALVTAQDIEAANGIIHVIDTVLLPPKDIVDTAVDAGFSLLVQAVQAAELEDDLRAEGPLTVFAPTDEAFTALGEATLGALLGDPETLANILDYHILGTNAYASEVAPGPVSMLNGSEAVISCSESGQLMINGANIIVTDVPASNGVIHVIDAVILPPDN